MANKTSTDKVKVRIPRTKGAKDDVYVAINDKTYLIRRGEEVEVPTAVYEVLREQERLEGLADEYIEATKGVHHA